MAVADPQKLMGGAKTTQTPVVQPQRQLIAAPADTAALQGISKSLTNIIQLLNEQKLQIAAEANQERKDLENARRKQIELGLENSFSAVKNVAQSVVAPVKNILDQIIQFFVTLFLGKALLNLIDWFSNPENQDKVRSIARFLKDWWPSLVAGYILFGTGFGRVVRNLAGIGLRAVVALGGIALKIGAAIANAVRLKKAGAVMSALGGGGGFKGIAARLLTGTALVAGGALIAKNMMGGGEDAPQVSVPEPATLPTAEAFGGGLIDFKAMLAASGGQVDSKLGIFAQLFGSGGFAGILNSIPGVVSGPKGIDKVPAMLTDGEFVMSRGAVQKFGVGTLEAMNASGGGTNRPKIVQKRIYAEGGGMIGNAPEKEGSAYQDPIANDNKRLSTDERFKRIEAQLQVQRKLSSGGGVQTSAGMGYGTTYGGRKSILVRNGTQRLGAGSGYNAVTVPKINVGGMEYFAQQKGKDIIYSSNFASGLSGQVDKYGARSRGYSGKGSALVGGFGLKDYDKKNLPKSKIMMGPDGPFVAYLSFKGGEPTYERATQRKKGMLESLTDFFDPKGAKGREETLNARTMRMTAIGDLEDMRKRGMKEENIKKMMNERLGPNGYSRAVNDAKAKSVRIKKEQSALSPEQKRAGMDAKVKTANQEFMNRGGLLGGVGRGLTRMFGTYKDIDKVNAADKASEARIKQSEASAMGKYYSSSDGKYYGNYAEAQKARAARLGTNKPSRQPITPTPKPAPRVYNPAGGGMGGRRGSGRGSRGSTTPVIPSGKDNRTTKNQLNIK